MPREGGRLIYLASQSPRRRELLAQIDVPCLVLAVAVDETVWRDRSAPEQVERLARDKAGAGWRDPGRVRDLPVLGADTLIECNGRVLGKPADAGDAAAMLGVLAGRTHQVHTGVALRRGDRCESLCVTSAVTMSAATEEQIRAYLARGEPLDKAGGYAIQGLGGAFVSYIEGSYSGIVGLPLYETVDLLRRFGYQWPHE